MSRKAVINVKCPCCSSILEVDVESERVLSKRKGRHLRHDARKGEDAMDVAFRQQAEKKAGAEDRFRDARARLEGQQERLDSLFRDATKKAKKDEEEGIEDPLGRKKIWD